MSRYDLDASPDLDEEMVRRALEASLQEHQFETGRPDEFAVPPRAGSRGNRGRPQFNTTPFGDDDGLDPQLALALRLSIEEEERRKQEEEKAKEEAAKKNIQEEKAKKKEEEERMRRQNERNNISPPHSRDHSTADETPPLSAEQQRELIRQSWLQKWGQGNSQPQPESTATVHTMNIDDNLVDTNVNRNPQETNVIVLSSDDEEEDSLQSRRKGQRRGRPRHRSMMDEDQVNVTGENAAVDSPEIDRRKPWKFPREESPPPPPDNDDSIMSDEVIARHLQEAEMRAESEDLEDDYVYNPSPSAFTNPSYGHPVSPSAQLLRRQQLEEDEEAERGKKKEEEERMLKLLREEQEKEDEAYAQQLQLMEQDNEDEDVGGDGGGGDWGVPSTAPVVVQRVTRTVTSPTSGRRVVTTTTTTRSSSSSSSSSATRGARRRSSDLSGLLSVLQSRGGIHRHPDAFAGLLSGDMNNPSHAFVGGDFGGPQYNDGYGLRRYQGIPLNYLRHSRGNDDELDVDNMSYEELLNLPTVERGVDDKNIFPVIKYVKGSDPSNTQCTVCLEDFEDAEELRVLPCFHKFHQRCIDTWLDSHKNCPVCKHDLAD